MSNPQDGFATRAIHTGQEPGTATGSVNVLIYLALTYAQQEKRGTAAIRCSGRRFLFGQLLVRKATQRHESLFVRQAQDQRSARWKG